MRIDVECTAAHLRQFVAEHGHGRVTEDCVIDGFPLGQHVAEARFQWSNDRLPAPVVEQLAAAGIQWRIPLADRRHDGLIELIRFHYEHGHYEVPSRYVTAHGYGLGRWFWRAKKRWAAGDLHPGLVVLLELAAVPSPAVSTQQQQWREHLAAYRQWVADTGGGHIKPSYVTADGVKLGRWVTNVRGRQRRGELSKQQIKDCERAGISWSSAKEDRWQERLALFAQWVADTGDPDPRETARMPDGYRIGRWWALQNERWRTGRLTDHQIAALEHLGAPKYRSGGPDAQWHAATDRMRTFIVEHGHAEVPYGYRCADGYDLYRWLLRQRREYRDKTMRADRRSLLEDMGVKLRRRRRRSAAPPHTPAQPAATITSIPQKDTSPREAA